MRSIGAFAVVHRAPVAVLTAVALSAGFAASATLGFRSLGQQALRWAGTGVNAPARFAWFYRDRLNSQLGSYTGISAMWFLLSWELLHQSPTSMVGIGSGDWLFLRGEGERDDIRGLVPWTADLEAGWIRRFGEWCSVAQEHGLPLSIAIAPNKSSLLSDRLLIGDAVAREQTSYGRLFGTRSEWPDEMHAAMLDLHGVLAARGPESCYFRSDTHWNYNGAGCAADAIAALLQRRGLAFELGPGLALRERFVNGGDLARLLGIGGEIARRLGIGARFGELALLPERVGEIDSIEDLQFLPPPPAAPRSPESPRVLVVHDSFGMILRDPLSARLPGCVYERNEPANMTGAQLREIIERESPDAIVILFVERRLTRLP